MFSSSISCAPSYSFDPVCVVTLTLFHPSMRLITRWVFARIGPGKQVGSPFSVVSPSGAKGFPSIDAEGRIKARSLHIAVSQASGGGGSVGKKRKLLPNGAGPRCEDLYLGHIEIRYMQLVFLPLHAEPLLTPPFYLLRVWNPDCVAYFDQSRIRWYRIVFPCLM